MYASVNGKATALADGTTVVGLLSELGLAEARVAVEHNRRILQRDEYASAVISDGDALEILGFVGGG